MDEKYLCLIFVNRLTKTLYVPKMIKDFSSQLAVPAATFYWEYKNKYPSFKEVIY